MHVQPGALKWCGSASLHAECVQKCLLFFVISVCCLANVVVFDPMLQDLNHACLTMAEKLS